MKTFLCCLFALLASVAFAQPRTEATLRVTVLDPSGAVIVGAHVRVSPADVETETGARGDAAFTELASGRYTIRVEAPGFEPSTVRDYRVRPGDNRREVKLAIAKLAETVPALAR
jgi:hypothetical protein